MEVSTTGKNGANIGNRAKKTNGETQTYQCYPEFQDISLFLRVSLLFRCCSFCVHELQLSLIMRLNAPDEVEFA